VKFVLENLSVMVQLRREKWTIILAFAAIYVIWGSTYVAILIGLNDIPPFLLSGIRFLVAGILLYLWCYWKRESLPSSSAMLKNSISGVLMLVGGTVSVAWAEQYLSSSMAAIIVTILPFWFVLLDRRQWKFYFSNKSILTGLLLGFAGVSLLLGFGNQRPLLHANNSNQWQGIAVILFGGIAWTLGSLYSKYQPLKTPLLVNGSIQLLSAGIFCLLISGFAGEWSQFSFVKTEARSWAALAYLVVMGSLVAYLSYLYLLKKKSPAQVSTYVYINPVIAVLLGNFIANETINFLKIIALIIILGGVLLVNLPKYKFRTT